MLVMQIRGLGGGVGGVGVRGPGSYVYSHRRVEQENATSVLRVDGVQNSKPWVLILNPGSTARPCEIPGSCWSRIYIYIYTQNIRY